MKITSRTALILVGLWLVSLLGVYRFSGTNHDNACTAAKVQPLVQSIARHDVAAVVGHQVERKAVGAEARQAAHTRQLIQENRLHAQANPFVPGGDCGLDAFSMYRWRAANRGATADAVGASDGTAAGRTAAAGEQFADGPGREPHRDGGRVSPLPRALQGSGGMAGADGS